MLSQLPCQCACLQRCQIFVQHSFHGTLQINLGTFMVIDYCYFLAFLSVLGENLEMEVPCCLFWIGQWFEVRKDANLCNSYKGAWPSVVGWTEGKERQYFRMSAHMPLSARLGYLYPIKKKSGRPVSLGIEPNTFPSAQEVDTLPLYHCS